jgi:hypothetical protein
MLGMEPKALPMLDKRFITVLHSQLRLPDLVNKNTGHPVIFGFGIKNNTPRSDCLASVRPLVQTPVLQKKKSIY